MKLDKLISTIYKSVLAASDEMQKRNLELLDIYFEKSDGSNAKNRLRDALNESISSEKHFNTDEMVEKVMASISPDLLQAYESSEENLVPKTVTIQYPRITSKGPVVHNVVVPLIAMVPFSMTELSSLTLKTNLEVDIVENELEISFPTKGSEENDVGNRVSLEVTIDKSVPPNGLQKLVEGYEKALRAQIPG